jgi:LysM repeat protein
MNPRSKAPARVLAFVALAAALVAILLVISSSVGDEDGKRGGNRVQKQQKKERNPDKKQSDGKQPAVYIVQSGDTLTAIAVETGVSVAELQELNPGIDPQILVSGQKLKLR